MVPYSTNRHGRIAVVFCGVYGCGSVVMGYLFIKFMGLTGVGLALLISEIIMAICVVPTALRMAGQSWNQWIITMLEFPKLIFAKETKK